MSYDPRTSKIICFDLDGTLADCQHRLHFIRSDWPRFNELASEDTLIPHTAAIFHALRRDPAQHFLVFWTARPESNREITSAWIEKHLGVETYHRHEGARDWKQDRHLLLMDSPEYTAPRDDQLKLRWAEDLEMDFCFEDRDRCVATLREAGYRVFQVAPGAF